MKKLLSTIGTIAITWTLLILTCFAMFACEDNKYKLINTTIVKGVVSAKEKGELTRRSPKLPKLYIQSPKTTIAVEIPFANENDYNVGDSITLIVQQFEVTK